MHFLSPIWLFAIAAIAIPVVIHLWNIREGKTLKVGSISLIEASSRKRSRSFKLIDLLLLLLRCLLLILLAIVLALPFFIKHPDNTKVKGWLLIPRENLSEAYKKFKPAADSLIKAGYAFHYFNRGLQDTDLTLALSDTAKRQYNKTQSYWSILQQLDHTVPASLPVYIITPNRLLNFTGERPKVALNLRWKTYTPADSASTWIQGAWFTANKDVRVVLAASNPAGTSFTWQTISSGAQGNSPFIIGVNNGQPTIGLRNNNQPAVEIDTTTLKIAIYADKNALDAAYLKAALESVAQFTQRKISIIPYNNSSIVKQDWLFWLSEKSPDKTTSAQYSDVFVYDGGKIINSTSAISGNSVYAVSQGQPGIPLYKAINVKNPAGEILWHDGYGNPVLSLERAGQTNHYHFYSRLNPSWSDLVWSNNFPKMMLQLIINGHTSVAENIYDRRTIAADQSQPIIIKETHIIKGKGNLPVPLTSYFWLALAILFFAERWLAHYNSNNRKEKLI